MRDTATLDDDPERAGRPHEQMLVLSVVWCDGEPDRAGECLVLPAPAATPQRAWLGRGVDEAGALKPLRLRPGTIEPRPPFSAPRLSREQLSFEIGPSAVRVTNTGRGTLLVDGQPADGPVALREDQLVEVDGRISLFVTRHPLVIEDWSGREDPPFGGPDADGIVGESVLAWELRRQLDFLGPRRAHVLLHGPSGAGKELAARGLHRRSLREGALVARNASTLPSGLADAELFGNARNYPNPGMAPRPGLVGAADGGTLFLDEIGDLPAELQPHLLRLLDRGEYHVLGEHELRVADLRVVGATHRAPEVLRHDLQARFPLSLVLPGLLERRVDLPLIATALAARILSGEPDLASRFLDERARPRWSAAFLRALMLRDRWTTNVRELEAMLWAALQASPGDRIDAPPVREALPPPPPPATIDWRDFAGVSPDEIPPEVLLAALEAHNGHQEKTAAALGFSSRFVLVRLIQRHKLSVTRRR